METKPERVFITGANGFVGAGLVRAEIAAGNEVHLLLREEARLWRLVGLEGRYIAHWGDLRDSTTVERAVRAARPEIIFHLAAHGVYASQRNRAAVLATNLLGTANLFHALTGHNYRALVHTGSSGEYGHKSEAMREGSLLEPRTDYAVSKAAASLLCQAESYRGAPVTTVRIFSAYGPWEDPSRLVPYVLDCCMRGVTPKVTTGCQPRDFIYIEDVVTLLRLAAREPACYGNILNAGTGVQSTVRDMIETIVAVCGSPVRPEFGAEPVRPDEPASWVASIDRTIQLTGWRPACDLHAGISRMRQWWLERPGRKNVARIALAS